MSPRPPNYAPRDDELHPQTAVELLQTLIGVCNESDLTRMEILGALEGAKQSLWKAWEREDEEEDED